MPQRPHPKPKPSSQNKTALSGLLPPERLKSRAAAAAEPPVLRGLTFAAACLGRGGLGFVG